MWVVIQGTGQAVTDGISREIWPGDIVTMRAGCRHTVIAHSELQLIEVQLGREINKNDKQKYPFD